MTEYVNWCRPQVGRARIGGGAANTLAQSQENVLKLGPSRKGEHRKTAFKKKTLPRRSTELDSTHRRAGERRRIQTGWMNTLPPGINHEPPHPHPTRPFRLRGATAARGEGENA